MQPPPPSGGWSCSGYRPVVLMSVASQIPHGLQISTSEQQVRAERVPEPVQGPVFVAHPGRLEQLAGPLRDATVPACMGQGPKKGERMDCPLALLAPLAPTSSLRGRAWRAGTHIRFCRRLVAEPIRPLQLTDLLGLFGFLGVSNPGGPTLKCAILLTFGWRMLVAHLALLVFRYRERGVRLTDRVRSVIDAMLRALTF